MRDYRGKRKDNGEWVYGYLIGNDVIVGDIVEFTDEYFNTEFWCKVDPETVGQYTGIKDKNGKEIYEGNTVLITGEQELDVGLSFLWNEKAIVKWSEDECGFYLDVINKREVSICQDGYFTVDTFPLRKWEEEEWPIEYEVVGNVWESAGLGEVRER
ncbi:YopX family protein [Paenibacillus sp. FSL R5-0527]|uniref:YopX family protein n=1 Tax=Paenibacillus sp. FSL R5-0527 TaxID=2975321 RepID=UPI00097AF529|nr:hypothetical protein BK140_32475 [Paenibacillus macerans]